MKSLKKLISIVLTIAVISSVATVFSLTANAATSVTFGDYTCQVVGNGTFKILSYNGTDTDIVLPEKFGSSTIVGIAKNAFKGSTLTSVTIPDSYTIIEDNAFSDADNITSITLPASLNSMGSYVFEGMDSLTSVDFSKATNLTALPVGTFSGCTAIKTFNCPENITAIYSRAFAGSSLKAASFHSKVTSFGERVFDSCTELSTVSLPSAITEIPDYTFNGCTSIITVKIPSSVKSIGHRAFQGCSSLTDLELPPFLESLGVYVFSGCSKLTKLFVPSYVSSIGLNCFFPAVAKTMTVQVYSGSYVETYCKENNNQYEVLDKLSGDANLDDTIDIRDVTAIQKYLVGKYSLSYTAMGLSDVTGDSLISVRDVTKIQKYLVNSVGSLD
jgi:hypothetical protein